MPDIQNLPVRSSPLRASNGEFIVSSSKVSLSERKALTIIQVLSFPQKHADCAAAIGKALKIECSTQPGVCSADEHTQIVWNGPNSWVVVCSDEAAGRAMGELFDSLKKAIGKLGAVVDQSHGRCVLHLDGDCARQVMAKNTAIDLHPRVFAAGHCAMTSVAHMNATVVQVDDSPAYDLFVIRSLGRSFAHAIEHACAEFQD